MSDTTEAWCGEWLMCFVCRVPYDGKQYNSCPSCAEIALYAEKVMPLYYALKEKLEVLSTEFQRAHWQEMRALQERAD